MDHGGGSDKTGMWQMNAVAPFYAERLSMGAANRISADTPTNRPPAMQKICRQLSEGTASRVML